MKLMVEGSFGEVVAMATDIQQHMEKLEHRVTWQGQTQ